MFVLLCKTAFHAKANRSVGVQCEESQRTHQALQAIPSAHFARHMIHCGHRLFAMQARIASEVRKSGFKLSLYNGTHYSIRPDLRMMETTGMANGHVTSLTATNIRCCGVFHAFQQASVKSQGFEQKPLKTVTFFDQSYIFSKKIAHHQEHPLCNCRL